MKKYLSLVLAAVLMLALAIPAFAESPITGNGTGSDSKDITAEYESMKVDDDASKVAKVYYVTLDWTVTSTLKYSDGTTTFTWNANETKYEAQDPTDDGWTGNAQVAVKVTNQSNDVITADAAWKAAVGIAAECTFENQNVEVKSAAENVKVANGEVGTAQSETITANVAKPTSGTISQNNAVVGTITVEIAPKVQ